MKKRKEITVDFVRESFSYCAETGVLTWKIKPIDHFSSENRMIWWNNRYSGKVAGCAFRNQYLNASLHKSLIGCHRIAWMITYGEIPDGHEIDHINGVKTDNRIQNLRAVPRSKNCHNSKMHKRNPLSLKGVNFLKKNRNYRASIGLNGKTVHLGVFPTKGLAALAYAKEAVRLHGLNSVFLRKHPLNKQVID